MICASPIVVGCVIKKTKNAVVFNQLSLESEQLLSNFIEIAATFRQLFKNFEAIFE